MPQSDEEPNSRKNFIALGRGAISAGADISAVKDILGHGSITSTEVYAKVAPYKPCSKERTREKVMLDKDLAALYGVETRTLNQAVKRNIQRFPDDFMFQLTKEECLRSQIATLNAG